MPNKEMLDASKLRTHYQNARDKVVEAWERFDSTVPDDCKPRYRQLMFEYLLDTFSSWAEHGDSLPNAQTLHYLARIREKVES